MTQFGKHKCSSCGERKWETKFGEICLNCGDELSKMKRKKISTKTITGNNLKKIRDETPLEIPIIKRDYLVIEGREQDIEDVGELLNKDW